MVIKMDSMEKRSVKTFFWTLLGSVMVFIFQIFAAKFLGAAEYGRANVIIGLASTYTVLLDFGFSLFIIKELANNINIEKIILSKFTFTYLILDLVFFPIIFIILRNSLYKAELYSYKNLLIAILLIFLNQFFILMNGYFIGISQQHLNAFLRRFLIKIINISLFLFIYYFLRNYLSILISQVISYSIILLILFKKLHFVKITLKDIKYLLKNSWEFYLLVIANSLFNNFSKYLQKLYGSNEFVGVLSLGLYLGSLVALLGGVLSNIAMPEFAKYWKEKKIGEINYVFKKISRYNIYIMLPVIIFIIINLDIILEFLGKEFKNGLFIVAMLLIASFLNFFFGPNISLLNMTGKQRIEIINGITSIVIGFSLAKYLGPRYYWGISASLFLSTFVLNLLRFLEVGIIYKIYPYTFKNFLYIMLYGLILSFLYEISKNLNNLLIWFILNVIIIVISIISMFAFSPEKEDRNLIKLIVGKLKK
jgi:O-antigen/teichoic acid export membrane protein